MQPLLVHKTNTNNVYLRIRFVSLKNVKCVDLSYCIGLENVSELYNVDKLNLAGCFNCVYPWSAWCSKVESSQPWTTRRRCGHLRVFSFSERSLGWRHYLRLRCCWVTDSWRSSESRTAGRAGAGRSSSVCLLRCSRGSSRSTLHRCRLLWC